MFNRLVSSSLLLLALAASPANACGTLERPSNSYARRGNRCEGILTRRPISNSFSLISLTSSSDDELGDNLEIKVPNSFASNLNVLIRAIQKRYRLDQLTWNVSEGYQTYTLPTGILRDEEIPLEDLRATAISERSGQQAVFVPVILQRPSNQYRFVFFSVSKIEFTNAEITHNGQTLASWGRQEPQRGEKAFPWNNPDSAPAGRYEFRYTAKKEGEPPLDGVIHFVHNPSWLNQNPD